MCILIYHIICPICSEYWHSPPDYANVILMKFLDKHKMEMENHTDPKMKG